MNWNESADEYIRESLDNATNWSIMKVGNQHLNNLYTQFN